MSVELAVQDIIAISTDIDPGKTDLDADLFEHGLDSLQVTLLVKGTNDYLSSLERGEVIKTEYVAENSEQMMRKLYNANIGNLPMARSRTIQNTSENTVALLTGPTGSLGAFGVVTTIIHNAWRVDFNLTVESFALDRAAVTSLVDFAARSNFGAKIFFLSSIGAVANWQSVSGGSESIPEAIFDEWKIPDRTGYAQSKFISERVLDTAVREVGVVGVVCRLGQISGPTTAAGVWPKREWLPSLVASSKYMGKVPDSLGKLETIDWVPVNPAARCVVELATHSRGEASRAGALVYHVVNPETCRWAELLPIVGKMLGGPEKVTLTAWVEALHETVSQTNDLERNPAVKLVDFFDNLASDVYR
ncbi:hypothetical protein EKO27_g9790 [Xylaria grammica]|uniref:Uncharacterized protein n=1 Tax=Xylaria grammica TaxID=363999 RepID=A0A439CT36_9PEZI|nr:hypothetical protein EKO27_g9790 [Xylaria grammica]